MKVKKTPLQIAAIKFIRAADNLLNAKASVTKHNPGVPAFYRATAKEQIMDAAYEVAKIELQVRLEAEDEATS